MSSGPYALHVSREKDIFTLLNEIIGKGRGLVKGASGGAKTLESSNAVRSKRKQSKRVILSTGQTTTVASERKGITTEVVGDTFDKWPERPISG